jgi:hypothetical protein
MALKSNSLDPIEVMLRGRTFTRQQADRIIMLVNRCVPPEGPKFTEAQIEAGKSAKGGFTRAQLAKWGVAWPPPHGWRKAITKKEES